MDLSVLPAWPAETSPVLAIDSPTHGHGDDVNCLAAEETQQIEAAPNDFVIKRPSPSGGWAGSFAASIFCHGLAVAAIAFLCARSSSTDRWRVARGSPSAEDAPSTSGHVQQDDAMPRSGLIAPPMRSAPPTDHQTPAVDPSPDDSAVLQKQQQLLPLPQPDPLIGIGESVASPPSPHFASSKFHSPETSSKSATTQAAARQTSPPQTSPPRIAGRRGERDGFDSRGLPIPDYPYESQRRGEEGVVIVDVEVLPSGRVGAVRITADAGFPRLGKAAAEKVKSANFEPALADGKPVVGHLLIPYLFTLQ